MNDGWLLVAECRMLVDLSYVLLDANSIVVELDALSPDDESLPLLLQARATARGVRNDALGEIRRTAIRRALLSAR